MEINRKAIDTPWKLRREVEACIDLLSMAPGIREETFSRFPEMRRRAIHMLGECSKRIIEQKGFIKITDDVDELRELNRDLEHMRSTNEHLIQTLVMIPEPHEL